MFNSLLKKINSHIVLLNWVEKTKQTYVLPLLDEFYCATTNFDLWMSKGANDVFTQFVIIFLGFDWKPKQIAFGLDEIVEIT